jgi:carbonic anhydrase/acetyltransferase-like protein (isoleucine patch superfamily)
MIRRFGRLVPRVPASAFVEESAQVIGEVTLGEHASVWFNAVIRGDVGPIRVGARSNIQDCCVVHCTRGRFFTTIGEDVTVGHSATLHGCTIGSRVLVGMGSTILDGAVIADDTLVAAGSLVAPGARFPPRSLVMGAPARVKRPLSEEELAMIRRSAENYLEYVREHRAAAGEAGGAGGA